MAVPCLRALYTCICSKHVVYSLPILGIEPLASDEGAGMRAERRRAGGTNPGKYV